MSDNNLVVQSSVARFGTSINGPRFEWTYVTVEDGEEVPHTEEFRARWGLTFDEYIEFNQLQAEIQTEAAIAQEGIKTRLQAISAAAELQMKDPGAEQQALDDLRTEIHNARAGERNRYDLIVRQILLLIAPRDRERFQPLLETAHPADARELKDHLERIVIQRLPPAVEAAATVDPTSPQPPSG